MKLICTAGFDDATIQQAKAMLGEASGWQQMGWDDEALDAALLEAEVLVGWVRPEKLRNAERLRWVQIGSAGVDRYLPVLPADCVLTNGSGLRGIPMAEHVLGMMLVLSRGLLGSIQTHARGDTGWHRQGRHDELFGGTLGVVGLGDIGRAVAERGQALGMHVLGMKRDPSVGVQGVDELFGPEGIDVLCERSDHMVLALPRTSQTTGLLSADRLARMKPGACVYNVGRGDAIDEAALCEALAAGHLGGAGLDVFSQEPLPADSPLWTLPNVIVSPHRSGQTPRTSERFASLFLHNLACYVRGELAGMRNVVDRERGY